MALLPSAQETMDPTAQDMSAQLAKLKNSGADAILLVTEVQQLVLILKQSQSLRLPQKLIVASASSSPGSDHRGSGKCGKQRGHSRRVCALVSGAVQ